MPLQGRMGNNSVSQRAPRFFLPSHLGNMVHEFSRTTKPYALMIRKSDAPQIRSIIYACLKPDSLTNPEAPCANIVYTLTPKYLYGDPFKAEVYTIWVHGALVRERLRAQLHPACEAVRALQSAHITCWNRGLRHSWSSVNMVVSENRGP